MDDQQSETGFFLTVAAFFETVIRDEAGVLTLVRMVDKYSVPSFPDSPERPTPVALVDTQLVVGFRGTGTLENALLSIQPKKPSGASLPRQDIPVFIEEGNSGFNVNINIKLGAEEEGFYWFDILLNNRFITRTPLQVVLEQSSIESGEYASPSSN
jgi:hypothetical protein